MKIAKIVGSVALISLVTFAALVNSAYNRESRGQASFVSAGY